MKSTYCKKRWVKWVCGMVSIWALSIPALATQPVNLSFKNAGLGIEKIPALFAEAPTSASWTEFLHKNPKDLESLWGQLNGAKSSQAGLGSIGWQWRLGWIRRCLNVEARFCNVVLSQALNDKAMLVRAEAATVLGQKFEDSKDPKILAQLEGAFKNPRNSRNGKPMFIQQRILFAIRQIGGQAADILGERLAGGSATTQDYWRKL
jgi:hypothetical protein